MNFIKRQYSEQYRFFRENLSRIFLMSLIVLLASTVVMYIASMALGLDVKSIIQQFIEQVTKSGVIDENGEISTFFLFLNNLKASVFATLYGFVPFIFIPLIITVFNGTIVGAVYAAIGSRGLGFVVLSFITGILPHGIFEIPAFLLSVSIGIFLCLTLTKMILGKNKRKESGSGINLIKNIVRTYILIIIPALVLAAIIECNVTPIIMSLLPQ